MSETINHLSSPANEPMLVTTETVLGTLIKRAETHFVSDVAPLVHYIRCRLDSLLNPTPKPVSLINTHEQAASAYVGAVDMFASIQALTRLGSNIVTSIIPDHQTHPQQSTGDQLKAHGLESDRGMKPTPFAESKRYLKAKLFKPTQTARFLSQINLVLAGAINAHFLGDDSGPSRLLTPKALRVVTATMELAAGSAIAAKVLTPEFQIPQPDHSNQQWHHIDEFLTSHPNLTHDTLSLLASAHHHHLNPELILTSSGIDLHTLPSQVQYLLGLGQGGGEAGPKASIIPNEDQDNIHQTGPEVLVTPTPEGDMAAIFYSDSSLSPDNQKTAITANTTIHIRGKSDDGSSLWGWARNEAGALETGWLPTNSVNISPDIVTDIPVFTEPQQVGDFTVYNRTGVIQDEDGLVVENKKGVGNVYGSIQTLSIIGIEQQPGQISTYINTGLPGVQAVIIDNGPTITALSDSVSATKEINQGMDPTTALTRYTFDVRSLRIMVGSTLSWNNDGSINSSDGRTFEFVDGQWQVRQNIEAISARELETARADLATAQVWQVDSSLNKTLDPPLLDSIHAENGELVATTTNGETLIRVDNQWFVLVGKTPMGGRVLFDLDWSDPNKGPRNSTQNFAFAARIMTPDNPWHVTRYILNTQEYQDAWASYRRIGNLPTVKDAYQDNFDQVVLVFFTMLQHLDNPISYDDLIPFIVENNRLFRETTQDLKISLPSGEVFDLRAGWDYLINYPGISKLPIPQVDKQGKLIINAQTSYTDGSNATVDLPSILGLYIKNHGYPVTPGTWDDYPDPIFMQAAQPLAPDGTLIFPIEICRTLNNDITSPMSCDFQYE